MMWNIKSDFSCLGYGYGFLAVTIVTLLPLLGFAMLPLLNKVVLQYILVGFTGLAVSTLLTDVAFHLIPIVNIYQIENENILKHTFIIDIDSWTS